MNGDLEESIHNDKIIELVKIEGIFFWGGGGYWFQFLLSNIETVPFSIIWTGSNVIPS